MFNTIILFTQDMFKVSVREFTKESHREQKNTPAALNDHSNTAGGGTDILSIHSLHRLTLSVPLIKEKCQAVDLVDCIRLVHASDG